MATEREGFTVSGLTDKRKEYEFVASLDNAAQAFNALRDLHRADVAMIAKARSIVAEMRQRVDSYDDHVWRLADLVDALEAALDDDTPLEGGA
jgi:hypothetical protein